MNCEIWPKPERQSGPGRTRLHIGVGLEAGVEASEVTALIMGQTGLPASVIGAIDIRERHLFVEVGAEYARGIAAKLKRVEFKGRRLKVKVA